MNCHECGKDFSGKGRGSPQRFCSPGCRVRAHRKHTRGKNGGAKKNADLVHRLEKKNALLKRQLEETTASNAKRTTRNDTLSSPMSVAVLIEKGDHFYVARNLNGNQWSNGSSPMEALGKLVMSLTLHQAITIESVQFKE